MAESNKSRGRKKAVASAPVNASAFEEMEAAKSAERANLEKSKRQQQEAVVASGPDERTREFYGIPKGWKPKLDDGGNPILEEADFYKHSDKVNTIKWMRSQIELRQTQLKLIQVETQRKVEVLTQNLDGLRQTVKRMEELELADIGSMLTAKYGVDVRTAAIDTNTRALISEKELQKVKP